MKARLLSRRGILHAWVVLMAAIGLSWMELKTKSLTLHCCYYIWECKQRNILLANLGNGLAPLPEQNTKYWRLVYLGKNNLPFLLAKLTQLMDKKYPDKDSYLSGLSRYVAFAIADASGWQRRELQEQAKLKDMDVEHYVLWLTKGSGKVVSH